MTMATATLRIRIDDLPPVETLTPEEEPELFGAGPKKAHLRVESHEDRLVQASHLNATLSGGVLSLQATTAGESVQIRQVSPGQVQIIEGGDSKTYSGVDGVKVWNGAGVSAID